MTNHDTTTTTPTNSEKVAEAMEIMVATTMRHMERTGCTLAEAMDAGAEWLYTAYPAIAAAITREGVAA